MVKNAITVFARVKPEKGPKGVVNYQIHRRPKKHLNEDFLVLTAPQKLAEYIDNRPESWNFSFHRIFEHDVPQVDVFESVARPVIDSVFDGYNATIFAYGQTGSGKTYAINGEPEIDAERGILPRTLQYVFDIVRKNPENLYTVEVAYLEIYNENGYDLLLERKEREAAATRLEDLPRVTIQEDESGTMHLKNLSFRIVHNEREALQFLLDGDTYRAISETPMNLRSSRSHCIFTIVVSVKKFGADRYSRAKMHLVDLAGSERVYKCAIQGTILTEAKHINLSLHFLEQVIVCLGQDNVSHVPYRNSLLTSVLRDSLGGNCLTTMLATLSVSNFNLEETISTCRFAQRVALVKNDVNLTFELDTNSENMLLKMENQRLRREIEEFKRQNVSQVPNSGNMEYYKNLVVQRDQEISHLIDLLKKERSRRASAIKEIPKDTKQLDEKYTQFPSSRSPRKIDQMPPNKTKIKRKHANSLQGKLQKSTRKDKGQSPEISRKITSLRQSTRAQVPLIQVPALTLEDDNDLDVRQTQRLDQSPVECKTSRIDATNPSTVAIRTSNSEFKDSEKSQIIESSRVLIERDTQTTKMKKSDVEELDKNKSNKAEEVKEPLVDQETPKVVSNTSRIIHRSKKCQILESPKRHTELDTQMPINEMPGAKELENRKNSPLTKVLKQEFPQSVMKMLRTSRNRPIEKRDESASPASNIPSVKTDSMGGSVDRTEDKRLSNPTKNSRDAKSDNIVRIPLPLTGDPDIDEEIIAFFKAKQAGSLY